MGRPKDDREANWSRYVGYQLRRERELAGIKRICLSDLVDISVYEIGMYEIGRKRITPRLLYKWCVALEIPVEDLLRHAEQSLENDTWQVKHDTHDRCAYVRCSICCNFACGLIDDNPMCYSHYQESKLKLEERNDRQATAIRD